MNLYRNESGHAKFNAQRNLMGRTHYVDDDTLRFHASRIISARAIDGGLLFAIVTSDAKNWEKTQRGFRYVIFDLFGHVVERNPDKVDSEWFRTSERATKAMWQAVNALDAAAIAREAIERANRQHAADIERIRADVDKAIADGKVSSRIGKGEAA